MKSDDMKAMHACDQSGSGGVNGTMDLFVFLFFSFVSPYPFFVSFVCDLFFLTICPVVMTARLPA